VKVLLVEDDRTLCEVIERNLAARGHAVTTANTAEGAMRLADEEPDALILDVNLPDGTGWDVLRRLGPDKRAAMRVIVISAAPLSAKRLEEFKPERWFLKPFPLEALMRALNGTPLEEAQEVS
jgi:DNA-binding response OmpR family regulator